MAILACPTGFEPVTLGLEGRCSYPTELRAERNPQGIPSFAAKRLWSGWRDLNSRHPGPKPGALPGYATPRECNCIVFTQPEQRSFQTHASETHCTLPSSKLRLLHSPNPSPRPSPKPRARSVTSEHYAAGAASAGFSVNNAFIDRRIRPLSSISSTLTLTTWPSLR